MRQTTRSDEDLMNISIRDATPEHAPVIADFNSRLAAETEDTSLEPDRIASGVAILLDDKAKGRYWVAEVDGKVIGQIGVTYEWSDWRNGMLWWIQSVYVHPDYRGQGVFSSLYRHVELLAQEDKGVRGLRLYVETNNARAQDVYKSLGMRKTTYQVMQTLFPERGDDENA
jgi:ribosomal protein S18 acetylase RimI-like enzyme